MNGQSKMKRKEAMYIDERTKQNKNGEYWKIFLQIVDQCWCIHIRPVCPTANSERDTYVRYLSVGGSAAGDSPKQTRVFFLRHGAS
jgi:hypothetical protein